MADRDMCYDCVEFPDVQDGKFVQHGRQPAAGRADYETCPGSGKSMAEQIAARKAEEAQASLQDPHGGCPCLHTTPCDPQCTCVHPYMSAGCRRCASYGSPEQQKAAAEHIAAALAFYETRPRTFAEVLADSAFLAAADNPFPMIERPPPADGPIDGSIEYNLAASKPDLDEMYDDPDLAVPTSMMKHPVLHLQYEVTAIEPEPEFIKGPCPIHGIDCRSNPPWDGISCGDPRGLSGVR